MVLEAKNAARTFFRNGKDTNYFYAVQKTDLVLEERKITEITGRSGSGKTTLANMLCGLLRPTEGQVLLDGQDIYAFNDTKLSMFRNNYIGIIPQGQTGLQSLTVLENVLAPAAMYGSASDKEARAEQLLEMMDIAGLKEVYSNELSGGELRRMSIARALINEPAIIIADEPTGDLDDDTTKMVLDLLRGCADKGASVLLVTHENAAQDYADIIYHMDKGVLKRS